MKTTIVTTALCIIGCSFANAQKIKEAEVPANAKQEFAKKYPGTKVKQWEKEDANYEAEFELKEVESSAVFDASGAFKELEQKIKESELPKSAVDYCTKTFAGYKMSEAAKITDASGKVTFEAEMKKGKEHFDVLFDDKGNFIKKTQPTTEKD
jgi:hypothetical protein